MPRNNPWGYSAGMPSDEFNRKRRARQTAPLGRPSQGLPQFAAPVAEPGAAPGAAAPGAAAPAAGMGMQAAQPIQAPQAPNTSGAPQPWRPTVQKGYIAPPPGSVPPDVGGDRLPTGGLWPGDPASTAIPGQFAATGSNPMLTRQQQEQAQLVDQAQPQAAPTPLYEEIRGYSRPVNILTKEEQSMLRSAQLDFGNSVVKASQNGILSETASYDQYEQAFRGLMEGYTPFFTSFNGKQMFELFEKHMPEDVHQEYLQSKATRALERQAEQANQAAGDDRFMVGATEQGTMGLIERPEWKAQEQEKADAQAEATRQANAVRGMREKAASTGDAEGMANADRLEQFYQTGQMPDPLPEVEVASTLGKMSPTERKVFLEQRTAYGNRMIEDLAKASPEVRESIVDVVGEQVLNDQYGYRPDKGHTVYWVGELGQSRDFYEKYKDPTERDAIVDMASKHAKNLLEGDAVQVAMAGMDLKWLVDQYPELKFLPRIKMALELYNNRTKRQPSLDTGKETGKETGE